METLCIHPPIGSHFEWFSESREAGYVVGAFHEGNKRRTVIISSFRDTYEAQTLIYTCYSLLHAVSGSHTDGRFVFRFGCHPTLIMPVALCVTQPQTDGTRSALGNIRSSLGNIRSSFGNIRSSLGNVRSSLGNVQATIGNTRYSSISKGAESRFARVHI